MDKREMITTFWVSALVALVLLTLIGGAYLFSAKAHTESRNKFITCIEAGNEPAECAMAVNDR